MVNTTLKVLLISSFKRKSFGGFGGFASFGGFGGFGGAVGPNVFGVLPFGATADVGLLFLLSQRR